MQYMSIVKGAELTSAPPVALTDAIRKLAEEGIKAGVFVSVGGLKPTELGFRARLANGKITVTDGPFAEAKEIIGGFAIYELKSKAEALEWTRRFLDLHTQHWPEWQGEVEVRPMYGPDELPGD